MYLQLSAKLVWPEKETHHKLDVNGRSEHWGPADAAVCQEQHARRQRPRCRLIWLRHKPRAE